MKKCINILIMIIFIISFSVVVFCSSATEPVNIINHKWILIETTSENTPHPRKGHSLTYVGNGKAILFGGNYRNEKRKWKYFNDTFIYDSTTKQWTDVSSLSKDVPKHRTGHCAAYLGNGKILLFGGIGEDGYFYLNDLWEYDINTNNWTKSKIPDYQRPEGRVGCSMSYISKGKAILFGGFYMDYSNKKPKEVYLNDTWEYDSENQKITLIETKGEIPNARDYHTIAYAGNEKLVMFSGGQGDGYAKDDTWEYDGKTQIWKEYAKDEFHPKNRIKQAMDYIGEGKIAMFGGYYKLGKGIYPNTTVWWYDTATHTWINYKIDESTTIQGRREHKMAYIGNGKVIMFGGFYVDDNENFIFPPETLEYFAGTEFINEFNE